MADPDSSSRLSPHESLPPVEPPSAGFLVQLFLIPGLIVVIIVVVWLLFHWLARSAADPHTFVDQLRGHGETRWQAAVNLAGALRSPENDALRSDSVLARDLAQILHDEITDGSLDERPINLRVYLCLALGQFNVDAGVPALVEAAQTQRDEREAAVRLAAVKSIGDLATNARSAGRSISNPELLTMLIATSRDPDPPMRAAAALALSAVGGPRAVERLAQMLEDSRSEVRYDVALGLAAQGDARAFDTLLEMLSADQSEAVADIPADQRATQEAFIQVSGLRAIARLADVNSEVDLRRATSAVNRLAKSDVTDVRENALAVTRKLQRRGSSETAPH